MSYIVVDVESDGPVPYKYSMVCFGAVVVEPSLTKTFYGRVKPEKNPFGFSARRIGDLYCGMKMDAGLNTEWKRLLRKTIHDHNPVNDARGNAEALLTMKEMGLKIPAH